MIQIPHLPTEQFYRALGTYTKAEERLNAITYNALKTAMGTLAQADIINMNDGAERNLWRLHIRNYPSCE